MAAVSTGSGGILSSGTNAPLYRSAFLDRADSEAGLETYEQRLALALDINQTDRVLQHTSHQPIGSGHCSDLTSSTNDHVWRDGAWYTKYPSLRLSFAILQNVSIHTDTSCG